MAVTTLTNYQTRVSAITGLENAGAEQTLITAWVNEGYEQFVADTHCFADWDNMALTAGTHTYTLPTEIMAVLEIYTTSGTTQYDMQRVSLPELVNMRRATSAAAPARHYAVVGANLISLYPTPGTGETLTVYWVPRPTALSTGSDTPTSVPAQFHQALEYYALARAGEYDDDGPSQFGTYWRALYEREVMQCKRSIRGMGGNRPAPLVPGMRQTRVASDPSVISR